MLGIQYQKDDERFIPFPDKRLPKPLIFLTCPSWTLQNQSDITAQYKLWLWKMLKLVKRAGFYSVVQLPVQFLNNSEITDSMVKDFIGYDFSCVYGIHFLQGQLSSFDYCLRLYALLRKGFTFALISDETHDYGVYTEHVRLGSVCVSPQDLLVSDSFFKILWEAMPHFTLFAAVVSQENYLRREWLWEKLLRLLSVLRRQSTRRLKDSVTEFGQDTRTF